MCLFLSVASLSLSRFSVSWLLGYRSEDAHKPTARQAGLSSPARRRKVCWLVCLFVCLPCVVVRKEPLWLCSGNASCGAWALDGPTNQPTIHSFIRSFLTTVRASWKMRARGAPRNSRGRLRPLPHTFHTVEGDSECLTQRLASSAGSLASFSTSPPLKAVGPALQEPGHIARGARQAGPKAAVGICKTQIEGPVEHRDVVTANIKLLADFYSYLSPALP